MQSAQESKNELQAAIRYAENAISAAQATIESIDFRQEMAKKNYMEQTGREESLTKLVKELEGANEKLAVDNYNFERELEKLRKEKEASSAPCGCQAYRDLEAQVNALEQPEQATMPVIPKDVAIAIFREGQRHGYNNESVTENLKGLCKEKGFECRIHGIDDND